MSGLYFDDTFLKKINKLQKIKQMSMVSFELTNTLTALHHGLPKFQIPNYNQISSGSFSKTKRDYTVV